jgi:hypothetical protein
MGLPVVQHPLFSLTLPSNNKKVEFRPFLVKEEKILLIAQSSGDQGDIVRAIKQVIANCIKTPDVSVEDFTTFDLEYFFIKLRAKSVQNIITLSYKDNEDGQIYDVEVNLDDVEVMKPDNVDLLIDVDNDMQLVLQYPKINIMKDVEQIDNAVDFNLAIMQACIYAVVNQGKRFEMDQFTVEERGQFIESLSVPAYQKIQTFVESLPRVEHVIGYTNSNGKRVNITLKTLTDFFTLG